jgi:hypothetical protein
MKRFAQVAVVLLCAMAVLHAQGQAPAASLPTVDQILDKAITAAGGRAALEKITSRQGKGTIEIPDAGMSGSIDLYEKAPNKTAVSINLGGMQIREAFDGTVAWSEDPQSGIREKAGLELADAKRDATFNQELHLKTLYPKMTVRGREKVGTMDTYVIDAVPVEGSPAALFFDAESGLLVRSDSSRESPMGQVQVQVYFEDFRVVDGIKMPFTMRQVSTMFTMVLKVIEVKHNVTLDDNMFKKPGL